MEEIKIDHDQVLQQVNTMFEEALPLMVRGMELVAKKEKTILEYAELLGITNELNGIDRQAAMYAKLLEMKGDHE